MLGYLSLLVLYMLHGSYGLVSGTWPKKIYSEAMEMVFLYTDVMGNVLPTPYVIERDRFLVAQLWSGEGYITKLSHRWP